MPYNLLMMTTGITRYIDPLLDFSFKKIFGSEHNKDLLMSLLNEIFRGRKNIVDLVYGKNEHPGDLKEEGGAVFDVLCVGDQDERFIIEIQRSKQENFKKRALYYCSRHISGQAPKGKLNRYKYDFTEVYLIAILSDFTLAIGPPDKFLSDVCLCDRDTGEIFHNEFGFLFIELRNFTKRENELVTNLDKWLYLLKNMSQMKDISPVFQQPVFEKLFNIAEYTNLTKEEKMDYDRSQKYRWDNQNALEYANKEGREIGKKEDRLEIALEMKKDNLPVEQIAKFTKLAIEEIESLPIS